MCRAAPPQSPQILSGSKFADFNGRGGMERGGFKLLTRCDLAFHSNLHTLAHICTSTHKISCFELVFHFYFCTHFHICKEITRFHHMPPLKEPFAEVLCDRSRSMIGFNFATVSSNPHIVTHFFIGSPNWVGLWKLWKLMMRMVPMKSVGIIGSDHFDNLREEGSLMPTPEFHQSWWRREGGGRRFCNIIDSFQQIIQPSVVSKIIRPFFRQIVWPRWW